MAGGVAKGLWDKTPSLEKMYQDQTGHLLLKPTRNQSEDAGTVPTNPFLCPSASDGTSGDFPAVGDLQGYFPSNEGPFEFSTLRKHSPRSAISIPNLFPDLLRFLGVKWLRM